MSNRHSNVEKHRYHGDGQCGTRRSLRAESSLSLRSSRECCAPYQSRRSLNGCGFRRMLASKALVASSPILSEYGWLNNTPHRCAGGASTFQQLRPSSKRDFRISSSVVGLTQQLQFSGRADAGDSTDRLSSSVLGDYAFRRLPRLLRETEFNFEETKINKIFASEWLNERQVVMGTKCNKLLVFDVLSHQISYIPMLSSSGRYRTADPPCGIHSISINPSRSLLATGGHATNDIAIYQLPTFDPVAICEGGHDDWVFGIDWIDDEFFVSGSRDSNICIYRVQSDVLGSLPRTSSSAGSVAFSSVDSSAPANVETLNRRQWTKVSPRRKTASEVIHPSHRLNPSSDSDSDDEEGSRRRSQFLEGLPHEINNFIQNQRSLLDPVSFNSIFDDDEGHGDHDFTEDLQIPVSQSNSSDGALRPRRVPGRRPILSATRRRSRISPDLDQIEDEQDDEEERPPTRRARTFPAHPCLTPLDVINCDRAEKIRAVAYNSWNKQVATLSLNAYFHLIDVGTFKPCCEPLRLPHPRENVCMSVSEDGNVFALGSQSHVTFVDSRVPKLSATRSIVCRQRGCGIRSLSFRNDVLTFGTGQGSVYFYDVRADKYLDLDCGAPVQLEAGVGWLHHDDTYHDFFVGHEYPNAIYTHCYDPAGTRLFAAGGPLPAGLYGNYAAIWH